jgi:hypothetical protein
MKANRSRIESSLLVNTDHTDDPLSATTVFTAELFRGQTSSAVSTLCSFRNDPHDERRQVDFNLLIVFRLICI